MPIDFACPLCDGPISAPETLIGESIRCPHCHEIVTAPAVPAPPATRGARSEPGRVPPFPMSDIRFSFTCPRCGSVLEGHSMGSGRTGRCPTCGVVLRVPRVDPRTGVPAEAAGLADDELPTPMHAYAAAGGLAPTIRRRDDGTQAIACPRCGAESPIEADVCAHCGVPFTLEGAEAQQRGGSAARLATVSLMLGVASVITFCFPLLSVAAIVSGALALHRAHTYRDRSGAQWLAIGGIGLGVIAAGLFAAAALW